MLKCQQTHYFCGKHKVEGALEPLYGEREVLITTLELTTVLDHLIVDQR
jgi:hypothetical protein